MFAHKIKLRFSRCPRTALQSCQPDFENWFSWRKDPPSVWARGLLDGEGMNRNSGLTTLSDSSIALSEDEKKAGEGQGSKKLQEFDGLGTKKKKLVTLIILHS